MRNNTQNKMGENKFFHHFVVFSAKLRNFTDRQFQLVSIGSASAINMRMRNEAGTGSEAEKSESEKAVMVEEHKPVSDNASEAKKVNVGVEKKALDSISLPPSVLSPDSIPSRVRIGATGNRELPRRSSHLKPNSLTP